MPTPSKLLLIYTGGTIGMRKHPETVALEPIDFNSIKTNFPALAASEFLFDMVSMTKVKDSSDICPEDWVAMAKTVQDYYEDYKGFVFLHGTDTMAFSASALSFMLNNLSKSVLFTGSQLPLGVPRTDALENVLTAMEIASAYENGKAKVPEVAIYFEYKLYRGNRSSKVDAERFKAYASSNYPPLLEAGVNLNYHKDLIRKDKGLGFSINPRLDTALMSLKIFPGIDIKHYAMAIKNPELHGLVIETYGAGNLGQKPELIQLLKQAVEAGKIVLNVSQCQGGAVAHGKYGASSALAQIGVLSGGALTFEAAITKLMCVLALEVSLDEKKRLMQTSLRGEM
ncbi:MAG: asparaginase [Flavobacteriales bacterium]